MIVVCDSALSNLTCASLNEDPYGVAQRDIPKILEGFVRFLAVLEGLEREFEVIAKEKEQSGGVEGKERGERWRRVERETVGVVQDGELFSFVLERVLSFRADSVTLRA